LDFNFQVSATLLNTVKNARPVSAALLEEFVSRATLIAQLSVLVQKVLWGRRRFFFRRDGSSFCCDSEIFTRN
jgi:hypothetical protein